MTPDQSRPRGTPCTSWRHFGAALLGALHAGAISAISFGLRVTITERLGASLRSFLPGLLCTVDADGEVKDCDPALALTDAHLVYGLYVAVAHLAGDKTLRWLERRCGWEDLAPVRDAKQAFDHVRRVFFIGAFTLRAPLGHFSVGWDMSVSGATAFVADGLARSVFSLFPDERGESRLALAPVDPDRVDRLEAGLRLAGGIAMGWMSGHFERTLAASTDSKHTHDLVATWMGSTARLGLGWFGGRAFVEALLELHKLALQAQGWSEPQTAIAPVPPRPIADTETELTEGAFKTPFGPIDRPKGAGQPTYSVGKSWLPVRLFPGTAEESQDSAEGSSAMGGSASTTSPASVPQSSAPYASWVPPSARGTASLRTAEAAAALSAATAGLPAPSALDRSFRRSNGRAESGPHPRRTVTRESHDRDGYGRGPGPGPGPAGWEEEGRRGTRSASPSRRAPSHSVLRSESLSQLRGRQRDVDPDAKQWPVDHQDRLGLAEIESALREQGRFPQVSINVTFHNTGGSVGPQTVDVLGAIEPPRRNSGSRSESESRLQRPLSAAEARRTLPGRDGGSAPSPRRTSLAAQTDVQHSPYRTRREDFRPRQAPESLPDEDSSEPGAGSKSDSEGDVEGG